MTAPMLEVDEVRKYFPVGTGSFLRRTAGTIRFDGEDVAALKGPALMRYRRAVQVVFQDPFGSLSPRMRVGNIISEPLEIHTDLSRPALRERVAEVLEL